MQWGNSEMALSGQSLGINGGTEQRREKGINQIYWLQTQQNCTWQFSVAEDNPFLLLHKPSQEGLKGPSMALESVRKKPEPSIIPAARNGLRASEMPDLGIFPQKLHPQRRALHCLEAAEAG